MQTNGYDQRLMGTKILPAACADALLPLRKSESITIAASPASATRVSRAAACPPPPPAATQPRGRLFKQLRPCTHQTSPPPPHTIFPALVVADSSPVPVAPAVASSSARCQPAICESRCPRDARRWLHTALAIVMLSSMCCVSVAQGTWSTAQLSVARRQLAATSVGNVAMFGGGSGGI
jgi:hypothetical protein